MEWYYWVLVIIFFPILLHIWDKYWWIIILVALSMTTTTIKQEAIDIRTRLYRLGIDYPNVVMAQMLLETGYFTSRIYRENHNLFGMKEPKYRKTYAIGTRYGHAVFRNELESLKDYKLYQDMILSKVDKKPLNSEEYIDLLVRMGYAEDSKYKYKLTYLTNLLKKL